jgi:hypothetical protein
MTHTHCPPARRPAALAAVLALLLAAPLATHAAEAMRVFRDPITGELRGPTAAEAAAFQKAEEQLRKAPGKAQPAGPVEVRYPDGTVETKLGADTHMVSVVKANEDGSLSTACLPAKQARKFVEAHGKKPVAKAGSAVKPVAATTTIIGKDSHALR